VKIELLQLRLTRNPDGILLIDMNFLVEEKTITRRVEYDQGIKLTTSNGVELAPWKVLMYELNKNLLNIEKEVLVRKYSAKWEDHLEQHKNGIHPDLLPLLDALERMSRA
jgi:hypothetical protein